MKRAIVQSITEVETLKQEFSELCQKLEKPTERFEGESPYLCWGPVGIGSLGSIFDSLRNFRYNFVKNVKSMQNVEAEHVVK